MNLHSILFWALWAAWVIMEIVVNLRARSLRKQASVAITKPRLRVVFFGGMYILMLIAFFLSMNGIGLMPTWVP